MNNKKRTPADRFTKLYLTILFCFCFYLFFPISYAASLDLAGAISLAQKNDAEYKAKVLESLAKNADGWAMISAMGPQVLASAKMMRSRIVYSPEETAEVDGQRLRFGNDSRSVILNQPLFHSEKIFQAKRGICEIDIAEKEQRKAREELTVHVVDQYFAVLAAQNELSLARAKLEILESQQKQALASHDLGLEEQADLFDVQARYASTEALLAVQEAKVVEAREGLAELLGEAIPGELTDFVAESSFSLPQNDGEYWVQQAKKQNVDAQLSRLQMKAARIDEQVEAGRFLPNLSFFVEYERTIPEDDLGGYGYDKERTDYGIKLEMELLSGGRDLAEMKAHEHRYQASRQRLLAVERRVASQITSTWNGLQRNLETIEAYEKAVVANKKSLAVKEANYKEGLQPMLDLLNVQRDFFIVSNRYQNAKYDYVTALVHFKQLVGELDGFENLLKLE